jgi:hypothetical protein
LFSVRLLSKFFWEDFSRKIVWKVIEGMELVNSNPWINFTA